MYMFVKTLKYAQKMLSKGHLELGGRRALYTALKKDNDFPYHEHCAWFSTVPGDRKFIQQDSIDQPVRHGRSVTTHVQKRKMEEEE